MAVRSFTDRADRLRARIDRELARIDALPPAEREAAIAAVRDRLRNSSPKDKPCSTPPRTGDTAMPTSPQSSPSSPPSRPASKGSR